MPQFPRRNTQPMRADSYHRIARLLRGIADKLDEAAEASTPQHKRRLTMLLHSLAQQARHWSARHRASTSGTLHVPHDRG